MASKPKTTTPTDAEEATETEPAADKVEMVTVEFRDQKFYVPKDRDDWDSEAFIAVAQGDNLVALQRILGVDQWVKLRRIGTSRRIANEFSRVFGKVAADECIN